MSDADGRGRRPPGATDWPAVVGRIVEGDRAAFAQLARLVTGFLARWRAFDFRDDWDDVVQEVIVAAVEATRRDRLDDPAALVGYIRRTARFKFVDRIRARQREAPDTDPEDAASPAAPWPAEAPPDAERRLAVWNAVRELPEKERVAVVEVYAAGKTYEEAARDSGIPLGSLKRYLRRGLAALQTRLEESS